MSRRLFVGNLSPRTTERELARLCSTVGPVTSVKIPVDRQSGLSRGFGFVDFVDDSVAKRALTTLNGTQLDGRRLNLGWARSREDRPREHPDRPGKADWGRVSPDKDVEEAGGARNRFDSAEVEDYTSERGFKPRRGSRHGSDRMRGRGTRRTIE